MNANLTSPVQGEELLSALHKHDCDDCVYLGRYVESGYYARIFDLYYHPAHTDAGVGVETVIARHGRDGAYYSGMSFAAPYTDITGTARSGIPTLVEAKRRAVERGLLVEPVEGSLSAPPKPNEMNSESTYR